MTATLPFARPAAGRPPQAPDVPFAALPLLRRLRDALALAAQFRAGVNNREEVTTPEQLTLDVQALAKAAEDAATSGPRKSTFAAIQNQEDAPPCSTCGSIMVRSGACYKCSNCGTTSGCA